MNRRLGYSLILLVLASALHGSLAQAAITTVKTSHRQLLFVAVTDGVTMDREQSNLTYNLEFEIEGPILSAGLVVPNVGTAIFSAATNGTTVALTLVSAPPNAYSGLLSGTLTLNFDHDGDAGSADLYVEFHTLDVGEAVLFHGYTCNPPESSDITPMAVNGAPPFGATAFDWNLSASSGLSGAYPLLVNAGVGGQQKQRWLKVLGGTNWTDANGDVTIEIFDSDGMMALRPAIVFDVLLRTFSDLTLFDQQVFYPYDGPISAVGLLPGSYDLLPTVDDGSTISLDPTYGGVLSASPVGGWAYGTQMDVEVSEGDFCTTLTVHDVDLRFRSIMSDGYTIFRGHVRGEEVIDLALIHDTYSLQIQPGSTAFPIISAASGTTPWLSFDENSTCTGISTPPPIGYWGTDDSFNLLVRDGSRPSAMIPRNVSFRAFPDELSFFEQQLSADPATVASTAGGFDIQAVDCDWLVMPAATPPIYLTDPDPRPVFTAAGALLDYLDGGATPTAHVNCLLIADGDRPWSAGSEIDFELRYFADDTGDKITPGYPLEIPENGAFEVQVIDDGNIWSWSGAELIGFDTGSVSVSGAESATGTFTATAVTGQGSLQFNLGPSQTNPDHPWVQVELDAVDGDGGVGVPDPDPLPETFALYSGYPNPFNPMTTLRYDLPEPSAVRLLIYDVAGRQVRTLISSDKVEAGRHELTWNGRDDRGRTLAAGVYFYRLETGSFSSSKRLTLVK